MARQRWRQIVAGARHGGFEAFDVVVVTEELIGAILRRRARGWRSAPGRRAVISALGENHGLRPVWARAVTKAMVVASVPFLAEHRPLAASPRASCLGEAHHVFRRARQRITLTNAFDGGGVDGVMRVPEQVRP